MESLNESYEPYTVPVAEVLELWQFHRFMTDNIPDIQSDLLGIARALQEIQGDMRTIKMRS
ncbi:hypothetical protein D3C87_1791430 [compost metagenome]